MLDVGCGHGYGSYYLATEFARSVVGIDTDDRAIEYARSHYSLQNLEFQLVDAEGDSFLEHKFQRIISFEVVEHLRNPEEFFNFVKVSMAHDGEFYLSTPNRLYTEQMYKNGRSMNPFHFKEYYPKELNELLSKYFKVIGIFIEYEISGYDQRRVQTLKTSQSDPIPSILRRVTPESLKALYFKARGLDFHSNRGRFSDYVIEEVQNIEDITREKPVQLFRLQQS